MNHQNGSDGRGALRRLRIRDVKNLTVLMVMVGALTLSVSAQAAEEGQGLVFDANLSLTGDCSESTIDPVPDPGCPDNHPPKPFTKSGAVAVDLHGNRYVASAGANNDGSEGRIDIFDSSGEYLAEVPVELAAPSTVVHVSIAVDSKGNLYVAREAKHVNPGDESKRLLRLSPTGEYNPAAGEIEYGAAPVVIPNSQNNGNWGSSWLSLAINPVNDHLFIGEQNELIELGSAAEGNGFIGQIPAPIGLVGLRPSALAIDAARDRLYVSSLTAPANSKPVIRVFDLQAPYQLLFTIDGSTTPTERFVSETWGLPLAADEASGHLFVGDLEAPTARVYEYDVDGNLVATIEAGFKKTATQLLQLAYDDSPTSPTQGYLFVPSHNAPGRSLAFGPPPPIHPPVVEGLSVSGITTEEAILRGKVNPEGLETTYRIEYTTEQEFLAHGFEGAVLAKEGTLPPVGEGLAVSVPVRGLSPAGSYRFQIVAENELGQDEADAPFKTYAKPEVDTSCSNQALRTGLSSLLPDCRAYELVTPADTNGHSPYAQDNSTPLFASRFSSPDGNRVSFKIDGGGLPDYGSTGSFFGDPYLATRTAAGWQTEYAGPSPAFAPGVKPGSPAPDQTYSFWESDGSGLAGLGGFDTDYIRYPDGHSELVGRGSLGIDPGANSLLVSEGGGHILFVTSTAAVQLEPDAAPDGTSAIYDRTPDGTTHVVSLLPGDVPLGAGQSASYLGASPDGKGVVFRFGATLYLRYDNQETYEVVSLPQVVFAGVAEGGERVLYTQNGDLFAYDVQGGSTTPLTESALDNGTGKGDVTLVNVSKDGSAAYFVSPSVLSGEANPEGDTAQPGEENLYLTREGQISFVGTVSQRDVEGVKKGANEPVRGLGFWLVAVNSPAKGAFAIDPSRSTADGGVLLFESNAPLTDYDPEGHTQVYRYDATADTLRCVSCNPTGPAVGEASMQSLNTDQLLFTFWNPVNNLTTNGGRAFFESTEALTVSDTDGLRDVYEWEEEGVGSCQKQDGCTYLITSGQSGRDDYLYAVSDSGDDVFFRSADLLAPAFDPDETPSIYAARVNGGFQPLQGNAGECLGEACQPAAVAPNDPTPASSSFQGAGNVKEEKPSRGRKACPKGKRAVRRAGKSRCVSHKKQRSKKHQKQAKGNRRTGR